MIEAPTISRSDLPGDACLVEFGHSIVKDNKNRWRLSGLLQPVKEAGVAPDGFRKFVRTGGPERIPPDSPHAIVGGGIMTTSALVELYRVLTKEGRTPKVVVHTGGRPGYLDTLASNQPDITEAKVMKTVFTRMLKSKNVAPEPTQETKEEGTNTEADIRNGLDAALKHDCTSVTFVGLKIRLDRCKAFYEKIVGSTDEYANLTVAFIPAEDVIGRIAASKGRTRQWEAVLQKFYDSEGYKRTLEAEQGGIAALQSGTYGESLGGKGKT